MSEKYSCAQMRGKSLSDRTKMLEELSQDGWTLVSVDDGVAYFKRKEGLPPATPPKRPDKVHRPFQGNGGNEPPHPREGDF